MSWSIEFTLIQHTPIIHFQYDEDGATLRASEVKPKLDKFLIKKLGGKDNIPLEMFVKQDRDQGALNYKLRFSCAANTEIPIGRGTDYDIFYGNMSEDVSGVMAPRNEVTKNAEVMMNVICFNEALKKCIQDNIAEFFIVTNFGRMQNKGFGSFTVDGELVRSRIEEVLRSEYEARRCYSFDGKIKPFKRIKTIYGIIKSGVNLPNRNPAKCRYRRSLLFKYMHNMHSREIGNEKAYLKQEGLVPVIGTHHPHMGPESNHRYVRALLGTGDHLEFIRVAGNPGNKVKVEIKNTDRDTESNDPNAVLIERFPSTIFFKVIKGRVYYVGKRIDEAIFGKNFKFISHYRGADNTRTLCTPSEGDGVNRDFMDDFLEYCYDELKLREVDSGRETPLTQFQDMERINLQEVPRRGTEQ